MYQAFFGQKGALAFDGLRPSGGAPFFPLVCKTVSVFSVAQAFRFEQGLTGISFSAGRSAGFPAACPARGSG